MGGVAKKAKKIGKGFGDLVDKSLHPGSTLKNWAQNAKDLVIPQMPGAPDQPLMPDYESIAKARRRGRTRRLGRAETLMSDTLG